MPYRRLPNTDAARLKALENAMEKSMRVSPNELAFSQKTLQRLRYFLPSFKQAIDMFKDETQIQIKHGATCKKAFKTAKMYVSHFIQVYNMAIMRGEIPANTRKFYGLERYVRRMPTINTHQEFVDWGKQIIDGEEQRIAHGGTPLMNPRIALVKIKYDDYLKTQREQNFSSASYNRTHEKVVEIRKEADDIILNIWNEVEANFENLSVDEKRKQASDYGIQYVFRPSELEDEY